MTESPPLLGRQEEMDLLSAALRRAMAGSQQLVLIEGEPGIGKTALLQAFAHLGHGRGWKRPRVFHLQALPDSDYEPVSDAALAATNQRIYSRLGGRRQTTEMVRSLLPDWLNAIPLWGSLMAAIAATVRAVRRRQRPEAKRPRLDVDEEVEAIVAAAQRRPLVLLLDDLERAGREAVSRLERLVCVADEGVRLLVVGAYRPTAPGIADPPIHQLFKTLPEKNEAFEHRRLWALGREDVEAWLGYRFPSAAVPSAFLDWLAGSTGGHPGTVDATLSHLLEDGAIRRSDEGWEFETDPDRLDLPVIGESFADLSAINPYIAAVVQAASVLGNEFDALTLSRLMERDELAVEDQLALGIHYGLLELVGETEGADGELTTAYRFTTPHLRAVLYRRVPPEQRAQMEARHTANAPTR